MDCLYAACTPIITDCVMAELEKLGPKYRLALQIARDERFERSTCDHKGTYADDCIVDRIMKHRIYIVATNDKDLCESLPFLEMQQRAINSLLVLPSSSMAIAILTVYFFRPENSEGPRCTHIEGRSGQISDRETARCS